MTIRSLASNSTAPTASPRVPLMERGTRAHVRFSRTSLAQPFIAPQTFHAIVTKAEEVDPSIFDQPPHDFASGDDGLDHLPGSLNKHRQPHWRMHPALAVMKRLHRQAYPQVAVIALEHAYAAADDVVEHLVAASEAQVVHGRSEVLHVNPVGHEHGSVHDRIQQRAIAIGSPIVVVQERPTLQVEVTGPFPWSDDKGGIVRKSPFRTSLAPIGSARAERGQQRPWAGHQALKSEGSSSFGARRLTSAGQRPPEPRHVREMTDRDFVGVEKFNLVGGGVVRRCKKVGRDWNMDAAAAKVFPYFGVVEQARHRAGINLAGLARAGSAVKASRMRVVGGLAAMPDQHHQTRQIGGQARSSQKLFGNARTQADVRRVGDDESWTQTLQLGFRKTLVMKRIGNSGTGTAQVPGNDLSQVPDAQAFHEGKPASRESSKFPPWSPSRKASFSRLAQAFILVGTAAAFRYGDGWRQENGQLWLRHRGANRSVARGQSEESGDPDGPHCGASLFNGAAEHLRTSIDAEDGL